MGNLPCCEGCQHLIDRACTECVSKADCACECNRVPHNGAFLEIPAHNAWECRYIPQCRRAYSIRDAEVEGLRAKLGAATQDLYDMANGLREQPNDTGCCFACKHNDAEECPGHYSDSCFEWRGVEGSDRNE